MTFGIPQRLSRLQSALAVGQFDELAEAFNQCADISPRPMLVWLAKAELRRQEGRTVDAEEAARQGLRVHPALTAPLSTSKTDWPALVEAVLGQQDAELLSWRNAVRYHARLATSVHTASERDDGPAVLRAVLDAPQVMRRLRPVHVAVLLDFVGFIKEGNEYWCEAVHGSLVRPLLEAAMRTGHFDVAFALEECIYSEHVKRRDSSAWFKQCVDRWIPALVNAVPEARLHPWTSYAWHPDKSRRIAFFVHTATLLAHVLVLLETLSACHRVGKRNYDFTVFVLARENAEMAAAFKRVGVRVVFLQREAPGGYLTRLMHLAKILREQNFAACVWVSLVTIMGMAFPCRIAPLQIWWSMKYHYCPVPGIDEHFAVENVVRFKHMEGLRWRTIGSASSHWVAPEKATQAAEMRAEFGTDAIVCSTVGREEKLTDPIFLRTICQLLRNHPNMVFLWTGKSQPPDILKAFSDAGVLSQTRFIGWVDTKLYAQVTDIFLDSFPFPCGFTLKEAMAAGKPAVMLRTAESLETGVPGAFEALRGDLVGPDKELGRRFTEMFTHERPLDLLMCATEVEEYALMADRLISDMSLRTACGTANRQFIEAFLSDPDSEGAKFMDHLDQIFAESPRLATASTA